MIIFTLTPSTTWPPIEILVMQLHILGVLFLRDGGWIAGPLVHHWSHGCLGIEVVA